MSLPRPPRSVLFVCSGNQCRSAVAEGLLRRAAARAGLAVAAGSAGTLGIRDAPAHPLTCQAAAELGVDLSAHRSRPVHARLLDQNDLILGMARDHVGWLHLNRPDLAARIDLFKPFCRGVEAEPAAADPDIADPVSGTLEEHRACVREISDLIDRLVARWAGRA